MSQADDNYPPAVPAPAPLQPPPMLQPQLSPPPSYIGATGPSLYPYPAQPPVQVNLYAPALPTKSPGLAAVLAGLFGCLGMLYATVPGAFIMFGINALLLIIGFFTLGIAWFLWLFTWIGGMVWAYMAADQHNKKLMPTAYPAQYPPTAPY
ncbi:hypothetical protein [Mycolicibacterium peregrinum]|jgi:hypothetical protein|uniref:hypothetical protein n=1 Tax=Mycolicibacterium peregrinum TaxID=43304 RepID=UPI000ADCDC8D|nr:hypothetical protein [Mycolicibacterium peregrinum]